MLQYMRLSLELKLLASLEPSIPVQSIIPQYTGAVQHTDHPIRTRSETKKNTTQTQRRIHVEFTPTADAICLSHSNPVIYSLRSNPVIYSLRSNPVIYPLRLNPVTHYKLASFKRSYKLASFKCSYILASFKRSYILAIYSLRSNPVH